MNENRYTPYDICNQQPTLRFCIPLYQRLFEWDKEQIGRLMLDLHRAYLKNKQEPYYIGMLTAIRGKDGYDLVDGQQRFTVMTLLGIVFGWTKFTIVNGKPRLHFAARDMDEAYLCSKLGLQEKCSDNVNDKMEKGIGYIRDYLEKQDDLKSEAEQKLFGQYIFNNLTFFISMLPSDYTPNDLNKYFERMNTTGKALEAHEILKVELIRDMDLPVEQKLAYIRIWNACAEMGRMLYRPQKGNNAADDEDGDDEPRTNSYDECRKSYSSAISRIIQAGDDFSKYKDLVDDVALDNDGVENFSYIIDIEPKPENPNLKKKRRQNVYPMLSFPEFLLQVLYITLDYPDNIETTDFFDVHQLITTFQHLPKEKVSLFYRNLLLYRLLMDFYMLWINDVEEDSNRYLLRYYVCSEERKKEELIQYQSMLYSASSAMTYYYWVAPLLRWLGEQVKECGPIIVDAQKILNKLYGLDLVWHPNPFDDKTEDEVADILRYGNRDNRYYFWRIDYYLWKNCSHFFGIASDFCEETKHHQEKILYLAEKYVFRRNRSIEHIASQHCGEDKNNQFNWKEYEESDELEKKEIALLKHDIGNLCMISSGLNSSLRDSAFEEKRGHVEACIHDSIIGGIESLKMLYVYKRYATWTPGTIREHHDETLEWLMDSYSPDLVR